MRTLRRLLAFPAATACLLYAGCVPREEIVLRDIRNLVVETAGVNEANLSGDAVFYNPNGSRMKVKAIKVDVFVEGKKAAIVDNQLNVVARANSEFTIPLKIGLQLKELGLMDTLKGLLGGKKYEIHYVGELKVNVNGIPMRIPIDHKEEFKLQF